MCNPWIAQCPCNQIPDPQHPGQCKSGGDKSNTNNCPVGVCKDTTNGHVTQGICPTANKCEAKTVDGKPVPGQPGGDQGSPPQLPKPPSPSPSSPSQPNQPPVTPDQPPATPTSCQSEACARASENPQQNQNQLNQLPEPNLSPDQNPPASTDANPAQPGQSVTPVNQNDTTQQNQGSLQQETPPSGPQTGESQLQQILPGEQAPQSTFANPSENSAQINASDQNVQSVWDNVQSTVSDLYNNAAQSVSDAVSNAVNGAENFVGLGTASIGNPSDQTAPLDAASPNSSVNFADQNQQSLVSPNDAFTSPIGNQDLSQQYFPGQNTNTDPNADPYGKNAQNIYDPKSPGDAPIEQRVVPQFPPPSDYAFTAVGNPNLLNLYNSPSTFNQSSNNIFNDVPLSENIDDRRSDPPYVSTQGLSDSAYKMFSGAVTEVGNAFNNLFSNFIPNELQKAAGYFDISR